MSREKSHQKIDELLGLLSINNSRLSLHSERLSQLDIDVLRKQCIDLYEEINKLALLGKNRKKRKQQPDLNLSVDETIASKPQKQESAPVKKEEKTEPIEKRVKTVNQKQSNSGQRGRSKQANQEEDEMLSLFEKFSSKPIASIPKAISVGKRFEFQSNFFEGDSKEYNEFMKKLDEASDREAAFEIYHDYKNKGEWDNEELKDELKALMYRKFS